MALSKLQELIANSSLSPVDKEVWLHTFDIMDDDQAQIILDTIQGDPDELEALTRNLKLKQIAFAQNDASLLDQILQEELETV